MAEPSGASVDADRARALERLQQLAADGVLSADESADRERRVRLAMTRAGIAQVFVGLPESANGQPVPGAGTYSTDNDGNDRLACHWERASGFTHAASEIIARDNPGTEAATVELLDGERFSTNDCGTWTTP